MDSSHEVLKIPRCPPPFCRVDFSCNCGHGPSFHVSSDIRNRKKRRREIARLGRFPPLILFSSPWLQASNDSGDDSHEQSGIPTGGQSLISYLSAIGGTLIASWLPPIFFYVCTMREGFFSFLPRILPTFFLFLLQIRIRRGKYSFSATVSDRLPDIFLQRRRPSVPPSSSSSSCS